MNFKLMKLISLCIFVLSLTSCDVEKTSKASEKKTESSTSTYEYRLPKAVFLTTGMNYGNGVLAEGVNIAIQSFAKHGIPVRLENRDILFNSQRLNQYDFLIMLSASEYHDGDKKHSLVYLSNTEMEAINQWVKNGGVLIAGDNIGRYYLDGVDRSTFSKGRLVPENWPLAKCFGVNLQEKNMIGYHVDGFFGEENERELFKETKNQHWALVPNSISETVKAKAWWKKGELKIPALTENSFGKGKAILLPNSYLLHPVPEGLSGISNIEQYYENQIFDYENRMNKRIELNPWPGANSAAFSVALDPEGKKSELTLVNDLFKEFEVSPTFFVNAHLDSMVRNEIIQNKLKVQSSGFNPIHSSKLNYQSSRMNVLRNEKNWNQNFSGYHFPFFATSFQGLLSLQEQGYLYDASIKTDHLATYKGSVFPYNIPISSAGYNIPVPSTSIYKSLDLLELSPHDKTDYDFFGKLVEDKTYSLVEMEKQSQIYSAYLLNYFHNAILSENGLMVHFAHLSNTGFNATTLRPLRSLLREIKRYPVWITTLNDVAKYWNQFYKIKVVAQETNSKTILKIDSEFRGTILNFTVRLFENPKEITVKKGEYHLVQRDGIQYLSFNAMASQEVRIVW